MGEVEASGGDRDGTGMKEVGNCEIKTNRASQVLKEGQGGMVVDNYYNCTINIYYDKNGRRMETEMVPTS